jgi:probable HAF family extracellular repeat protein
MARTVAMAMIGFTLALADAAAQAAEFRGLGHLPGDSQSDAMDVSSDGAVVVGFGHEAFRWTEAGGLASLGAGAGSIADAVSADGAVVVGHNRYQGGVYGSGFRWTAETGSVSLGAGSAASDVSADGTVIAGWHVPPGMATQAAIWTSQWGWTDLGDLGGTASQAAAISRDGTVVVGVADKTLDREAFRWTGSTGMVGLGHLPGGFDSTGKAVSDDGSVVVGDEQVPVGGARVRSEAFRWTEEDGMVGLGRLPGGSNTSQAFDVSADGSLVLGLSGSAAADAAGMFYEAFLWDAMHGMRSLRSVLIAEHGLDLDGWFLINAQAISRDGRVIVGSGRNPDGEIEAWLVRLDAPPACDDGADNDGDGLVDLQDPGCPVWASALEDPECDDGIDNDGDGGVDAADSGCTPEWPFWESRPCGIGAELVLVLPLLAGSTLRRRAIRRLRSGTPRG